jgi:hypothetical protein
MTTRYLKTDGGSRKRILRWSSAVLCLAAGFAFLGPGNVLGQITEAATQSAVGPQPKISQLDGDTAGDLVKSRPAAPTSDQNPTPVYGQIQKVSGRQFSVQHNDNGVVEVFRLAPGANITLNREPAQLADLKTNDSVRVTRMAHKPELAVTVAATRGVRH